MTNTTRRSGLQLLLAGVCAAATADCQSLTQAQKDSALRYLAETRAGVVDAVSGLSETQWKFKPAADRWSAAEIVEHLALVENMLVQNILANIEKAPPPAAGGDPTRIDAMLLAKVPDRTTKLQAPAVIAPTGRWIPSVSLERFLADRAQTVAILETTADLRQHVINHPALGPLDGYQWVLAVAAHSARHTKQILEVKADPGFPAN